MTKNEALLTWDEIDRLFTVDAENGKIYWKVKTSLRIKIGDEAGYKDYYGYVVIRIHGKLYRRHRLIWWHTNKSCPSKFIDHINEVKGDDRISNLREATKSQNMHNISRRSRNTSGYTGVSWSKHNKKWVAQLRFNNKPIPIGHFPTKEAAALMYNVAAKHLFGDFAKLNVVPV